MASCGPTVELPDIHYGGQLPPPPSPLVLTALKFLYVVLLSIKDVYAVKMCVRICSKEGMGVFSRVYGTGRFRELGT